MNGSPLLVVSARNGELNAARQTLDHDQHVGVDVDVLLLVIFRWSPSCRWPRRTRSPHAPAEHQRRRCSSEGILSRRGRLARYSAELLSGQGTPWPRRSSIGSLSRLTGSLSSEGLGPRASAAKASSSVLDPSIGFWVSPATVAMVLIREAGSSKAAGYWPYVRACLR